MLNKKKFISLALAAGLTVTLVGCNTAEKEVSIEPSVSEQVANTAVNSLVEAQTIFDSANSIVDKNSMTQEEIDGVVIDYYESLNSSLDSLWQDVKENGPEALNEVTDFLKNVVINVVDFKNERISINGIYYSDLSEEGKKIVDGLIGGLATTVAMINPDLSEDLIVLFGEDIVNSATDTKDSLVQLGSDVLDWAGEGINNKVDEWRKER